jgi:hypothetical protein
MDYVRNNPGTAAARLAGGVAGGVMGGGLGGAFTGQAAGGRMAQGTKTLVGAARQWNMDRKTKGLLGATKANIGQAAKGALDVGMGAMAFKGMHDKFKERQASDDQYNRGTEDRVRGVGKRASGETDVENKLASDSAQQGLGQKISTKQVYDRRQGGYVDNDPNSETYGQVSRSPYVDQDSAPMTGKVTTSGGKTTFDSPATELNAQRQALQIRKLQARGQDDVDFGGMRDRIKTNEGYFKTPQ